MADVLRWTHAFWVIVALILLSCAQTVPLTGGEADKQPPRLINSSPDTLSTNFSASKIKLVFDEYVEIDNPRKNVLITPLLRHNPTIVSIGKSIVVRNIDDSLWENSTYTIEFNDAIRDITERNAASGFRYVFSTGSYIDSLSIRGIVRDAYTLKFVEGAHVFLYTAMDDSLPYLKTPRYIGRSDKNGLYHIGNIRSGRYKLFVCTDQNRNYIYDGQGDKIDFATDPVVISPDTVLFLKHFVFKEDVGNLFLKSFGTLSPWSFYLVYSKPIDTLEFLGHGPNPDSMFTRNFYNGGDSIVFWSNEPSLITDTLKIYPKADTLPVDTVSLLFPKKNEKARFNFTIQSKGGKIDLDDSLIITFDLPLSRLNKEGILLFKDTLPVQISIIENQIGNTLSIVADWQEESDYLLVIDSASFENMAGLSNDSIGQKFSTPKKTFYGTLEIKTDVGAGNSGILILMDKNENAIETVYLDKKNSHYFEYLYPGEYKVKYIYDDNKNRRWDTGNYMQKMHAESVKIYNGTITIRSNWDQVIEWLFN